jgi:hypothetical protein
MCSPGVERLGPNRNRTLRVPKNLLRFMKHTIWLADGCLVRQNPRPGDACFRSNVFVNRETLLQLYETTQPGLRSMGAARPALL